MPVELPPYSNLTTSKDAAKSVAAHHSRIQKQVLTLIQDSPEGKTCDEVEVLSGFSHQTASSAIRQLTQKGMLFDSRLRKSTRSGRKAIQWKVTTP